MVDRPRLGVALMVLGMIVLILNALLVVAHYVEGWPIPSVSLTIVGMTCVILAIFFSFFWKNQ